MANKEIIIKYQIKPHETHIVYICVNNVNKYKYVRIYIFIGSYIRFCWAHLCRDGSININNLVMPEWAKHLVFALSFTYSYTQSDI